MQYSMILYVGKDSLAGEAELLAVWTPPNSSAYGSDT